MGLADPELCCLEAKGVCERGKLGQANDNCQIGRGAGSRPGNAKLGIRRWLTVVTGVQQEQAGQSKGETIN